MPTTDFHRAKRGLKIECRAGARRAKEDQSKVPKSEPCRCPRAPFFTIHYFGNLL
jgi:hypothetical protein